MDFTRCTAAVVAAGTAFAIIPSGVAFAAETHTRLFTDTIRPATLEIPGGATLTMHLVGGGGRGGLGGAGEGGGGGAGSYPSQEGQGMSGRGGGAGSSGQGGWSGGYVECTIQLPAGAPAVVDVIVGDGGYGANNLTGGTGGAGGKGQEVASLLRDGEPGLDGASSPAQPDFGRHEGHSSRVTIKGSADIQGIVDAHANGGFGGRSGSPGRGGPSGTTKEDIPPAGAGAGAPAADARDRDAGKCDLPAGSAKPDRVIKIPPKQGKAGAANGDANATKGGVAVGDKHGPAGRLTVPANADLPRTAGGGGDGGEWGRGGDGGDGGAQGGSGFEGTAGANGGPGLRGADGAVRLTWTTK